MTKFTSQLSLIFFLGLVSLPLHSVAQGIAPSYPPFESLTEIQNPFSLRDPFLPPKAFREGDSTTPKQPLAAQDSTLLSEQEKDSLVLSQLENIANMQIVGIITGMKKNKALVNISGRTIILEEGMKVGRNGGKILAIREKGLVYAERQQNIYRKEEVVEKVMKVSDTGEQVVNSRIRDKTSGE